jgi:hypothetical protein
MTADASAPRPLPIRLRPMTGDSPASYVRRLARANHLRPGYLRRYLRQPGSPDMIRLDWLAVLAGRSQSALERALTGHQPAPAGPHARQAGKPGLFVAIRRDARDNGLSTRALADRHGVHRRTIRQALASPWPAPRKAVQLRGSRLDPFKDVIDAMISAPLATGQAPLTAKLIHARLVSEHGMTRVSYSTVSNYVSGSLPARQLAARNSRGPGTDAPQAIARLKEALEAMQPGLAIRAQPHLDALERVITQSMDSTGVKTLGAEPGSAREIAHEVRRRHA